MGVCSGKLPQNPDPTMVPVAAGASAPAMGSTVLSSRTSTGPGEGKQGLSDPEVARTPSKDRAPLVLKRGGSIHEAYEVEDDMLGQGCNGVVRKGKRRSTGVLRAIKSVQKGQMRNVVQFKKEVEVMKMMDHPNIIKLFEVFEDPRKIYLVMELCEGGELFDRIIAAGRFTEHEAAIVMQQILRAVCYMHEKDITHRDLKPENFLFLSTEPIESNVLKLIDFGLSCHSCSNTVHKDFVGTPQYVAPQVLLRRYDRRCDLWSCGVIMCTLLSGRAPFGGKTQAEVLCKVREGTVHLSGEPWEQVTNDAKNLLRMLLKRNPRERYTAEQALAHSWIRNAAPNATMTNLSLTTGFVERLRDFRAQSDLKKAALRLVADQLSDRQTGLLRSMFYALDSKGNGVLTLDDLRNCLNQLGLQDKVPDFQQALEDIDITGTGAISYTEFLAAALDQQTHLHEEVCWTAFNVFEQDKNGRISQDELLRVFSGSSLSTASTISGGTRSSTSSFGVDRIGFQEFMTIVRDA